MSIGTVITLGYGNFSVVNFVPTMGYGNYGVVPPTTVAQIFFTAFDDLFDIFLIGT